MKNIVRICLIGAILTAQGGCSGSAAGDTFDLVEFAIDGPTSLGVGTESINVTNSGTLPHTLVVTDASGHVVAATDLVQPGESAELGLDLEAGDYSFTCRIVAENGQDEIVDHYEAGMNLMVSVSR